MDTLIAIAALLVAAASLGLSIYFWRRSFRPIVTVAVKTHTAGNVLTSYDLVVLNSGTIPAKNIRLAADDSSLTAALGGGATEEKKKKWLAAFNQTIPILQNMIGFRAHLEQQVPATLHSGVMPRVLEFSLPMRVGSGSAIRIRTKSRF